MKIHKLLSVIFLYPAIAYAENGSSASTSASTGLLQIFLALVFVICLMLFGAWLLKRINPINSNQKVNVKIVGGTSLGNRERVIVLEIADQWLVVGVTANQINVLSSMPKTDTPLEEKDAATVSTQFSHWLIKTIDKRNNTSS